MVDRNIFLNGKILTKIINNGKDDEKDQDPDGDTISMRNQSEHPMTMTMTMTMTMITMTINNNHHDKAVSFQAMESIHPSFSGDL